MTINLTITIPDELYSVSQLNALVWKIREAGADIIETDEFDKIWNNAPMSTPYTDLSNYDISDEPPFIENEIISLVNNDDIDLIEHSDEVEVLL